MCRNAEQSATDYILRGEKITNSVRYTGETVSDSLIIAMLLEGLLCGYKPCMAVNFGPDSAELITKEGIKFDIKKKGKIYFHATCNLVQSNTRTCHLTMCHHIMGHCNTADLLNLENVVVGMKIKKRNIDTDLSNMHVSIQYVMHMKLIRRNMITEK